MIFLEDLAKIFAFMIDALDDRVESVDEIEDGDFTEGTFGDDLTLLRNSGKKLTLFDFAEGKVSGRVFKLFVFDELSNQVPAWIFFFGFLIGWTDLNGKKGATFEVNEIGGHDDKLASDLEIEHLKGFHELEVLGGDAFQRNVIDIDLIFFDEVKKQVEWSFKDLQFDAIFLRHEGVRLAV